MPGDLEIPIAAFVGNHIHQLYHESVNNLTPADFCTWRRHTILLEREKNKEENDAIEAFAAR